MRFIMSDLNRSYSDEEIQSFFDHFMKSSGNLNSLRKLFGLAHSNNTAIIPDEVVIALESTLCDRTLSAGLHTICASILQEILPSTAISYDDIVQEQDDKNFNILMLLLALQNNQPHHKIAFCKTLLKNLNPVQNKANMKIRAMKLLAQWVTAGQQIPRDEIEVVAKSLKICLGPLSLSSVKVKKKDKIMEMDGSSATEMCTLLTLPESITEEYYLHVQTFSIMNQIWPAICPKSYKTDATDQLQMAVLNCCLRIIEQTQRFPLKSEDNAFQRVALIEAINLLDKIVLSETCQTVTHICDAAEDLFVRYSDVEVVLPLLQLLIHLSVNSCLDLSDKLEKLFSDCLTKAVYNQCSSGEIIFFLKQNLSYLNSLLPSPLRQWFPNILKILAWHPVTFADDFDELIPTFMNENTSIEVLNLILDLPITTLVLIYSYEPLSINKNDLFSLNKREVQFALRKSSQPDENIIVNSLYNSFKSISNHPRVKETIKIAPDLLRNCLEIITTYADDVLALNAIKTILERSLNMSPYSSLKDELNKIFADAVLLIFLNHPRLVVDAKENILQYFQLVEEPTQELCTNMVWIVSHYTSTLYIQDLQTDLSRVYYDALECLFYEHISSLTPSAISISVLAFVKLSSRTPDTILRAKLYLNKVKQYVKGHSNYNEEWEIVINRINEASVMLENASHNQDSLSVDTLIRFVAAITENNPTIVTASD